MTMLRTSILLTALITFSGCSGGEPDAPTSAESDAPVSAAREPAAGGEWSEIVPGLQMRITAEGDGDVATAGQLVTVHYTGWLHDPAAVDGRGQKFDSSVDRGQYFEFPLGARRVIQGWDQGVAGMRIGETRELLIAPEMGYGDRGAGNVIPPGATLLFEVELAGLDGNVPGAQ
jgi:FKBP-type peptidyl-prolyl cis-trans isomerase FkpA